MSFVVVNENEIIENIISSEKELRLKISLLEQGTGFHENYLLSKSETAEMLKICKRTLDKYIKNGELKSCTISGPLKFKFTDVVDFVNKRTV